MSISVLPSMETTFTISIKGAHTGQQFDGTFTYRKPNLGKQTEITKLTARLNEGLAGLDGDTVAFHEMVARLKFCIIQGPDWWAKSNGGLELYDVNVILEIFNQVVKFDREWLDKVWVKEPEAEQKPEIEAKAKKK